MNNKIITFLIFLILLISFSFNKSDIESYFNKPEPVQPQIVVEQPPVVIEEKPEPVVEQPPVVIEEKVKPKKSWLEKIKSVF